MPYSGPLVGRGDELDDLLQAVRSDDARHVLLTAAPGMGKTALIDAFRAAAHALVPTLLTAHPTESERSLAFSGLADLLRGIDERSYDDLPEPQRRGIRAALLLEEPTESIDPRAVAAALHAILARQATAGRVLVVVDDAQWLDRASVDAMSHALRRLDPRDVLVVAAARPAQPAIAEWLRDHRAIGLVPLDLAALFHVVREHTRLALDHGQLRALHADSGGNPLFALELTRHGKDAGPGGALDDLIGGRIWALPRTTRLALLAAALSEDPSVEVVARACAASPHDLVERLEPARTARLVDCGSAISFVHPLFARVAVDAAADVEVRAVHEALAGVLPVAESRARHRALATVGEDPRLADDLDLAARAARHRAAWDAGIELLQLAVEHTPAADPALLERTLRLGGWLARGGRAREAEAYLRTAHAHGGHEVRARAALELAWLCTDEGRTDEADTLVAELSTRDTPPAVRAAALLADPWIGGGPRVLAAARAAERILATVEPDPEVCGIQARAATIQARCLLLGAQTFAPELDRALVLERDHRAHRVIESAQFVVAYDDMAAARYEDADDLLRQLLAEAEATGDENSLPVLECHAGWNDLRHGRWASAGAHLVAASAAGSHRQQGTVMVDVVAASWRGLTGHVQESVDRLRALEQRLQPLGPYFQTFRLAMLGSLELADGRTEAAWTTLGEAVAQAERGHFRDPGVEPIDTDWADAAVTLGRLDGVEARLGSAEERARRLGRDNVLADCLRVRLQLQAAEGDVAGAARRVPDLLAAFDSPHRTPLARGRAMLVAGRIHRRAKARRLAQQALTAAATLFDTFGYASYATQARTDLARVGLRVEAMDELTHTERQVAELAASGLHNKEIAQCTFLSVKTVEGVLSRVYRKLRIRSRAELAHALARSGAGETRVRFDRPQPTLDGI